MSGTKYVSPQGPSKESLPKHKGKYDPDKLLSEFEKQFQKGVSEFHEGKSTQEHYDRAELASHNDKDK